jgi:Mrp family chromosome partitioning ATPase
METTDTFTLQQFLGVLRRRGWIVLQLALIVAVAGVAIGMRASREYQASASIIVGSEQVPFGAQQTQGSSALSAPTAAKLVETRSVAERVRRSLGTDRSVGDLLARVSTSASIATQLVTVTARGASGNEAAQIANAFARQFVATRAAASSARLRQTAAAVARALVKTPPGTAHDALMTELTQIRALATVPTGDAQVADIAVASTNPSAPHLVRNGLLGLGLGALLGLLAIFAIEALDPRVKDSQELQRLVPAPQLASVPASIFKRGFRHRKQPRVLAAARAHFEPFERLRTSLLVFNGERELRTVLITSPSDEREGKTTVAANLAVSLAKIGLKVCLVDGDLRKPRLARHFGLYGEFGLSDLLQGAPLKKVVQKFEVPGGPIFNGNGNGNGNGHSPAPGPEISVITAGKATPHPAELLASKAMQEALDELEQMHDIVLIDCSPLLAASDTMSLLGRACGTVLVVRLFHTPRKSVVRAVRVIERARGELLGVVGTGVSARELREEGFGPWPAESSQPAARVS